MWKLRSRATCLNSKVTEDSGRTGLEDGEELRQKEIKKKDNVQRK